MSETEKSFWEKVRLGEVLGYTQPNKYITNNIASTGKVPVLTANKAFVLGYTDELEDIYEDVPAIIFDDFTTAAKLVDFPFKVRSSALKILNTTRKNVSLKFIFECLNSLSFQSPEHKRYWISEYQNLQIPLPSYYEQERIADILGTVDEKMNVIDQQILETEELKKGLMQRLLTKGIGHTEYKESPLGKIPKDWEVKKIGEITKVVRGASPRPKGDPRYYGGHIPRLMGADVTRDGKYVTPCIDFLTEAGAKKSRFMYKGTLVMICSGDVGVPAILNVDACVHDGFLAFPEISRSCSVDYLFYIFDSLHSRFNTSATHGGVFTNLTTTIIKEFEVPIPSLKEQNRISEIISTVDEKLDLLQERKEIIRNLKKGLMQKLLQVKSELIILVEA